MKKFYVAKSGCDGQVYTRKAAEDLEAQDATIEEVISGIIDDINEIELFKHLDEEYKNTITDKAIQMMIEEDFIECNLVESENE